MGAPDTPPSKPFGDLTMQERADWMEADPETYSAVGGDWTDQVWARAARWAESQREETRRVRRQRWRARLWPFGRR